MEKINLKPNKKIYFASDFHLGAPTHKKSLEREKRICNWLDQIKADAQALFLVGDLFDFWHEYKQTVPKGYVRFLGKLAELSDSGIRIIIFSGNHDMWMEDYFDNEIGTETYHEPKQFDINNKLFFIGHGDGLGPGDHSYKLLKVVFKNPICRFMFGRVLHSNLGMWLGYKWASHSWKQNDKEEDGNAFVSEEKEILLSFCKDKEQESHFDYYIFGHRHQKFDFNVTENSKYYNLGDWIRFYSYGEFDGENFRLIDNKNT